MAANSVMFCLGVFSDGFEPQTFVQRPRAPRLLNFRAIRGIFGTPAGSFNALEWRSILHCWYSAARWLFSAETGLTRMGSRLLWFTVMFDCGKFKRRFSHPVDFSYGRLLNEKRVLFRLLTTTSGRSVSLGPPLSLLQNLLHRP